MSEKITYTVSSGNVFADLGDPAPQESLLKAQLAHRIGTAIRAWTDPGTGSRDPRH